jgi:putative transposase
VKGIHPGAARVPFITLEGIAKVLPTFKQKEVTIVCEPGVIRIGTFSLKNPDIELGLIPDQQMSIPVDLAPLDMLALGRVLKPR